MDEVIADFTGGAAKVFGLTVKEMGEKFGSWWSGDDFWNRIKDYGERRFWEELEMLPWATRLLLFLREVENNLGYSWMIVTAPQPRYSCYVGKLRWIQKWFPPGFDRFEIVNSKFLLAAEGRILIDDSRDNCKRFEDFGGQSILFPSRFNEAYLYLEDPVGYVADQFSLLHFEEKPNARLL